MTTDRTRAQRPLASRRTTVGYTQAQLAHALGVNRATVARWERRLTTPSPRHRRKLAELLAMTVFELADLLTPGDAPVGRVPTSRGYCDA